MTPFGSIANPSPPGIPEHIRVVKVSMEESAVGLRLAEVPVSVSRLDHETSRNASVITLQVSVEAARPILNGDASVQRGRLVQAPP
jgi:hypothetical protein